MYPINHCKNCKCSLVTFNPYPALVCKNEEIMYHFHLFSFEIHGHFHFHPYPALVCGNEELILRRRFSFLLHCRLYWPQSSSSSSKKWRPAHQANNLTFCSVPGKKLCDFNEAFQAEIVWKCNIVGKYGCVGRNCRENWGYLESWQLKHAFWPNWPKFSGLNGWNSCGAILWFNWSTIDTHFKIIKLWK